MSAPKRTRLQAQNSLTENLANSPRIADSSFRLLQILDNRLEKQSESISSEIKAMIKESEDRILTEINKKITEMRVDLNNVIERVSYLETAMCEISNLKTEIKDLKIKALKQANSLVACDIRLNGIPYTEGENLPLYFENICQTINIPTPVVKSIYRLQNKNNKHQNYSPDAVIIVKLHSPYDKNYFLKTLSEFRRNTKSNLSLSILGFQTETNFYIKENLTHSNYQILQAAVRLRKQNQVHSAYTYRGLVYIKHFVNDNPICIEHINMLDTLFRSAETSREQHNADTC